MGLAASQGRLLLLTARKSDLEYQAQQISQRRLLLSTQLEEISREYSTAVGNRKMMFNPSVIQEDTNNITTTAVDLTYSQLIAGGDNQQFRVVSVNGKIAVPSASDIPSGANKSDYEVLPGMNNKEVFQHSLRTGALFIQQRTIKDNGDKSWDDQPWQSMESISDVYYTEDDAKAQSIYETKSAKVQAQDRQLELELKQIDTQHQAVQTEVDSVGKVIQKNIEKSFKIFENG